MRRHRMMYRLAYLLTALCLVACCILARWRHQQHVEKMLRFNETCGTQPDVFKRGDLLIGQQATPPFDTNALPRKPVPREFIITTDTQSDVVVVDP